MIAEILTNNNIQSQSELLRHLAEAGHNVTQATLSRDLRLLKTVKVSTDEGGYRYVIKSDPQADTSLIINKDAGALPRALSIDISGNIVVIKTRNGYASGLAYDIDLLGSAHVLGTIPGADTVFVVVNENSSRAEIYELFCGILSADVMEAARGRFS